MGGFPDGLHVPGMGQKAWHPGSQTCSSQRQGGTAWHQLESSLGSEVLTSTESVLPETEGNKDYLLEWFKTQD